MNLRSIFHRLSSAASSVPFFQSLDFLTFESEEKYRERRAEYVTGSALAEFKRNPLLFRRQELGLRPEGERSSDQFGRAVHALVLEGLDAYRDQYAVDGPVDPQSGERYDRYSSEFRAWACAQSKPALNSKEVSMAETLAASVHNHPHALRLLSDGVAGGVVRANYGGVPCQARLDWVNPREGLVEFETCIDLDHYPHVLRLNCVHQAVFKQSLLKALTGTKVPIHFIVVETDEPFRTGVWRCDRALLAQARKQNEQSLERLRRCRVADRWPSGFDDVRTLSHPW